MKEKCPVVNHMPNFNYDTSILCFCLFNFGRNNFPAAHNDLIAIVITQSNLMVTKMSSFLKYLQHS